MVGSLHPGSVPVVGVFHACVRLLGRTSNRRWYQRRSIDPIGLALLLALSSFVLA
jgi:hypothetical protein